MPSWSPWFLIAARAAAAVIMAVALAAGTLSDTLVLWLFVVAFVSDYFDGAPESQCGSSPSWARHHANASRSARR